jgi:hypothetical protein
MHSLFVTADRLSGEVIGAATLVRRVMGPGVLESINLTFGNALSPFVAAR